VLYSSTSLDHAVSSITVRQGAYLFGIIRPVRARRIVEIGRFKGEITLIMAAAAKVPCSGSFLRSRGSSIDQPSESGPT
jgi:hypothetical protein